MSHLPPSPSTPHTAPGGITFLRETILQRALYIVWISAALGYLWVAWTLFQARQYWPILGLTLILLWLSASVLIRRQPQGLRIMALLMTLGVLGSLELLYRGPLSTTWIWLLALILMAYAFLGQRGAYILFSLVLLGIGGMAALHLSGWVAQLGIAVGETSPLPWVVATVSWLLVVGLLMASYAIAQQELYRALQEEKALTYALEAERAALELRIEQRTRDLRRHRTYLEVASLIAREISLEADEETLFRAALALIQRYLGFYHAGIFTLDASKEYAVLRAASSEAGQRMIAAGHRLRKGVEGIVGYVVETGEARIALDVGKDAVHFKNPYLPETRSEIALPIRVGQEIIGALDIQSTEVSAFSEGDIQVLQAIADQLGVALERRQLVNRLQEYATELETRYRQVVRQQWRDYLRASHKPRGYRWHTNRLEPVTVPPPEIGQIIRQAQPLLKASDGEQGSQSVLYLPIRARGEAVGIISVKFKGEGVSEDTLRLLNNTAERIGLALENARLLEMMRVRAEREHLVSELGSRVQAATDVEGILRAAALEIGRTLGVSEVLVQLRDEDQEHNEGQPGGEA
ncbi:GAF domain-containing protein [uncultured Thermanaerothrix sp.]|uniref:GAF domain-containing protein n=1 Tax=uncultured Thermanaerothrix sp. TaxID=1195149 RepID=UPI00260D8784|nr:GAF domain-containing protein [uncultured Thermanaerothrix sp.]